jgi:hypothetical protein
MCLSEQKIRSAYLYDGKRMTQQVENKTKCNTHNKNRGDAIQLPLFRSLLLAKIMLTRIRKKVGILA